MNVDQNQSELRNLFDYAWGYLSEDERVAFEGNYSDQRELEAKVELLRFLAGELETEPEPEQEKSEREIDQLHGNELSLQSKANTGLAESQEIAKNDDRLWIPVPMTDAEGSQLVVPVTQHLKFQQELADDRRRKRLWRRVATCCLVSTIIFGVIASQKIHQSQVASSLATGIAEASGEIPVYALAHYRNEESHYFRVPAKAGFPIEIGYMGVKPSSSVSWTRVPPVEKAVELISGITTQQDIKWSEPSKTGILIMVDRELAGTVLVRQGRANQTSLATIRLGSGMVLQIDEKPVPLESRQELLLSENVTFGHNLQFRLACLKVIEGLLKNPDTEDPENIANLESLNAIAKFVSKEQRDDVTLLLEEGLTNHIVTPPDALKISVIGEQDPREVFPGKFVIEFDDEKSQRTSP